MRLHEFTDPTKYILPETDTTDLLNQTKNVWADDTADDAVRQQATTLDTKNIRLLAAR